MSEFNLRLKLTEIAAMKEDRPPYFIQGTEALLQKDNAQITKAYYQSLIRQKELSSRVKELEKKIHLLGENSSQLELDF